MNFLVATVTKLPPIKVPYGRQRPEAAPMVSCDSRGWFTLGKPGMGEGKEGGVSELSNPNLVSAGCGFRKANLTDTFPSPLLGFCGSTTSAGASAPGSGLHQPFSSRVRPHASGFLSSASGPGAVQGPSIGATQEVSQFREALGEALYLPARQERAN